MSKKVHWGIYIKLITLNIRCKLSKVCIFFPMLQLLFQNVKIFLVSSTQSMDEFSNISYLFIILVFHIFFSSLC